MAERREGEHKRGMPCADLVRIAASADAVGTVVAPALGRLAAQQPEIDASFVEASDNAAALALVQDGRADIAVTLTLAVSGERHAIARRSGMRSTFLFAEEIVALSTAEKRANPLCMAPVQ